MEVEVRYHLSVRLSLKRTTETFDIEDGSSVGDLVGLIVSRYGSRFGDPAAYVFAVEGEPVEPRRRLQHREVVSIYPPTAGG